MSLLLTDEEIQAMSPEPEEGYVSGVYYYYNDGIRDGAKAQLKKVYDWGYEDCPHNNTTKKKCDECWQALLEEVK